MGKLSNVILKLDFESQPAHTVEFVPDADTQTIEGRNGPFDVIPVQEEGIVYHLALSNQSLVRQLQKITKPCKLRITRTGASFDTKYSVENLGPLTQQTGLKK